MGMNWARVLAFVSLTLIPTLVFYLFAEYLFAERHIVTGLTAGAVEG
jgi:raffinose/stachyose/melibiose transport system permease protein